MCHQFPEHKATCQTECRFPTSSRCSVPSEVSGFHILNSARKTKKIEDYIANTMTQGIAYSELHGILHLRCLHRRSCCTSLQTQSYSWPTHVYNLMLELFGTFRNGVLITPQSWKINYLDNFRVWKLKSKHEMELFFSNACMKRNIFLKGGNEFIRI